MTTLNPTKSQELLYIAEWLKRKGHELKVAEDNANDTIYVIFSDRDFKEYVYCWTLTQLSDGIEFFIEPSIFCYTSDGNISAWTTFVLLYDRSTIELLYREFLFAIYRDNFTNKTIISLTEKDFATNMIQPSHRDTLLLKWASLHGFNLVSL